MSSINSVAAIPYMPLTTTGIDEAAAAKESATAAAPAPQADPRRPALAPETAAALIGEQALPNAATGIDLSGQDLRDTDLKSLNLKGANLRGADLSGMDLSGLDLSGADLSDAKLSGAVLNDTNLTGVSAQRADLRGATMMNTVMNGADFSGGDFRGAYVGGVGKDDSVIDGHWMSVDRAKFDGANFQNAVLRVVSFQNGSANGADFSNATADVLGFKNMSVQQTSFDRLGGFEVHFSGSDASGAAMTNMAVTHKVYVTTNVDGARFAGSSFNHTSFGWGDLRTADLSGMVREAQFASFGLANLGGIDFSGFDFFGASFRDEPPTPDANGVVANFTASYDGTNFSNADFDHTMFYKQGDLSRADFTGAKFNQVVMPHNQAPELARRDGVKPHGLTYSWEEAEALSDMRFGRRPVEHGLRMADPYIPSAGLFHALDDQDPNDRVEIARLWAKMGFAGVMDPLGSKPALKHMATVPPTSPTVTSASPVDSESAALDTLRSVNDAMRAAREKETDGEDGLVKLFKAARPEDEDAKLADGR